MPSLSRVVPFHHDNDDDDGNGYEESSLKMTMMMAMMVMTKNRLMVAIHSKDVTEILALYRMTRFDFPPHFLVRLMHSFPMMYNTI